jgi:putative transposase
MPNYRRARNAGATYFFTVVTAGRRALLVGEPAIAALRQSVAEVQRQMPFSIDAWVVLPDHMHALWTLPENDADFSSRWGRIKAGFTRLSGLAHTSAPRQDGGVWQPRFWEHLIRDDADFDAHMDYLHYNPVKHGYVSRVIDWRHSSFHRCARQGFYPVDWGDSEPVNSLDRHFGE